MVLAGATASGNAHLRALNALVGEQLGSRSACFVPALCTVSCQARRRRAGASALRMAIVAHLTRGVLGHAPLLGQGPIQPQLLYIVGPRTLCVFALLMSFVLLAWLALQSPWRQLADRRCVRRIDNNAMLDEEAAQPAPQTGRTLAQANLMPLLKGLQICSRAECSNLLQAARRPTLLRNVQSAFSCPEDKHAARLASRPRRRDHLAARAAFPPPEEAPPWYQPGRIVRPLLAANPFARLSPPCSPPSSRKPPG